ncbi:MAG: aromatic amino acid lyase [Anaerolineales bacterium]|nr:aromatic amino acid lyase [Anaerolineales bacterium]
MTDLGKATPSTPVNLNGNDLTLDQVSQVARSGRAATIAPEAMLRVQMSHEMLSRLAEGNSPVYGVNTGFGIFSNRKIQPDQSRELSRNLILSHAVGVGAPFPESVTRAAMLIRINSLAIGNSGATPHLLETLLSMLNKGVTPIIPSQGSMGSSGDLAPLAHLALVLSRPADHDREELSGEAWFQGVRMTGLEAMHMAGIPRVILGPKEGLALINGATFSAALLALDLISAERILRSAEGAAALSFEALQGVRAALDKRLHASRHHPGQIRTAAHIRTLLEGSTLLDQTGRVQDSYSLRCAPQIIGPAWETLAFVRPIVEREINAATDNPLLYDGEAISGGNFHGQLLGLAADYLKIALTEVASVAERRVYKLLSGHSSEGLPLMLVADQENAGFHSGLMMLQYTAASLVLENQHIANPDSIHSLPTSAGQEDHNANSTTAARHLRQITANCARVVAIELLAAAQAIDIRKSEKPACILGAGTASLYQRVRTISAFIKADRPLAADVEQLAAEVLNGVLLPDL